MSKITYIKNTDNTDSIKHSNTIAIPSELCNHDIDELARNESIEDNDDDNCGDDLFGYNKEYKLK